MKYNKKLDNVLFIIMMLVALTAAVWAFVVPSVHGWTAGIWVLACALGFWLSKGLQSDKESLRTKNDDLNRLYQDTVAEKLNYKFEKEDLAQRVLELEKEVSTRDQKIQELSDKLAIEGMKDLAPEEAPVQETPSDKLIQDIDDLKASIVKVKSRRKKKQ